MTAQPGEMEQTRSPEEVRIIGLLHGRLNLAAGLPIGALLYSSEGWMWIGIAAGGVVVLAVVETIWDTWKLVRRGG